MLERTGGLRAMQGARLRQRRLEPYDAVTCLHEVDTLGVRIGARGARGVVTGRDAADGGEVQVAFCTEDAPGCAHVCVVPESSLVFAAKPGTPLWRPSLFVRHVQRHLPHNPEAFVYQPRDLVLRAQGLGFGRTLHVLHKGCHRACTAMARKINMDMWALSVPTMHQKEEDLDMEMVIRGIAVGEAHNSHKARLRELRSFGMSRAVCFLLHLQRASRVCTTHQ